MATNKEKEKILAKLSLLEKVMKLHAWTILGSKEAEKVEKGNEDIEKSGEGTNPR